MTAGQRPQVAPRLSDLPGRMRCTLGTPSLTCQGTAPRPGAPFAVLAGQDIMFPVNPVRSLPVGDRCPGSHDAPRQSPASLARLMLMHPRESTGCARLEPRDQSQEGRVRDGQADSAAVSLVEGWRGQICHFAITGPDGKFRHYKVVDPSFHNWQALAMALRNGEISDFPLCNKSFNLSYCGRDL